MERPMILAERYLPGAGWLEDLLLAGYSSYPRHLEYEKFREIADEVGAIFMVDAAHYIGLVAGKAFPNPIEHADAVTFTTHKALRGARGGSIITNNEEMGLEIQKGLFPNAQGGSLYNQIAGKAVCFHEAAAKMLDRIGVTLNFNTIPFDPRPPYSASGLRIGTPSVTTQGMKEEEMVQVADLITETDFLLRSGFIPVIRVVADRQH